LHDQYYVNGREQAYLVQRVIKPPTLRVFLRWILQIGYTTDYTCILHQQACMVCSCDQSALAIDNKMVQI
jgi:hypothetical protein